MHVLLSAGHSVPVKLTGGETLRFVAELYLQCLFPSVELQLGVAGSLHRQLHQGREECSYPRSRHLQQIQESLKG